MQPKLQEVTYRSHRNNTLGSLEINVARLSSGLNHIKAPYSLSNAPEERFFFDENVISIAFSNLLFWTFQPRLPIINLDRDLFSEKISYISYKL